MQDKMEQLFAVADKRIARLGYSVWDCYICPEIITMDIQDDSFRFSYDLHTTLFGPPQKKLLERYQPKGEISLSFDPSWISLVREYFTEFKLMDKSAVGKEMNTFLCMKLIKENFKRKENPISQLLSKEDSKNLPLKRKILLNQGLGGVGIFVENEIIGGAFSPHHVNNERFSFALIRGVWVNKDHRGKGLGLDASSKMCDGIFDYGIKNITLWVEEVNVPAIKIYEKLGFQIVEKVHGVDCVRRT